jgi:uncharacterized protein
MRLSFDEITGKIDRFSITDSHWFPSTEEYSVIDATADISVSRKDYQTVTLKGVIDCTLRSLCDRCGEFFEENFQSDFVYLITLRPEETVAGAEQECSEEDVLTLYLGEPIIEVDQILTEQALLVVPLKRVCSEDCKGICPGCGMVLNRESCRCSNDRNDSPFAVLKKLKKQ